jgi:hypothetical protein
MKDLLEVIGQLIRKVLNEKMILNQIKMDMKISLNILLNLNQLLKLKMILELVENLALIIVREQYNFILVFIVYKQK